MSAPPCRGLSAMVSVPWSHCPHLHQEQDAGELPQLLLHPIPLNHFAYTPLQICLLSMNFALLITFQSLLHSLKSFCCSRLVTSPGKWELQLLWSRSCKLSVLSPPSPCRHPQSSRTMAAPAASTASHRLLHRENHWQSCVFQREALVYMGLMVLTVSLLLHCSLKTRCGLWFATRLSTKLA